MRGRAATPVACNRRGPTAFLLILNTYAMSVWPFANITLVQRGCRSPAWLWLTTINCLLSDSLTTSILFSSGPLRGLALWRPQQAHYLTSREDCSVASWSGCARPCDKSLVMTHVTATKYRPTSCVPMWTKAKYFMALLCWCVTTWQHICLLTVT